MGISSLLFFQALLHRPKITSEPSCFQPSESKTGTVKVGGCEQEPLEASLPASRVVFPPNTGRSAIALSPGLWMLLYTGDKSCLCLSSDPDPRRAGGQRLGEGSVGRRGRYKESGRRRQTGAAGGQAWGVGSEGMGPLDSVDWWAFQQACIPSEKVRIPEM